MTINSEQDIYYNALYKTG